MKGRVPNGRLAILAEEDMGAVPQVLIDGAFVGAVLGRTAAAAYIRNAAVRVLHLLQPVVNGEAAVQRRDAVPHRIAIPGGAAAHIPAIGQGTRISSVCSSTDKF